jgi:glucose/arabinose dehydrogenase
MKPLRCLAAFACFALLASGGFSTARAQGPSITVSPFAMGLTNPRGLKFGPDGYLYVAEGGSPTGTLIT